MQLIGKSSLIAILPMLFLSFGITYTFLYFESITLKVALTNAIPYAIISSAIAIPSAKNLAFKNKEFVTYESSLSDIFGVILFNFITLNSSFGLITVGSFFWQLIVILVVTFVATLGLALLLGKIKHHIKFAPIILIVILIYSISKYYHLPALIYVLLFGLFLGNLDEMKGNRFIQRLHPDILKIEVLRFKELTTEITFLIRSLFFILFGYLIETNELFNSDTAIWAIGITFGIFAVRYIFLKLLVLPIQPLLFIAPRGLITILLFLSIPIGQGIKYSNKSLIIQVVILTSLIMMIGLMTNKSRRLHV